MKKSILILEDDRDTAQVLQEYLQDNSLDVELAASGWQAVSMFKKRDFDLLVTDFKLPDSNGVEVVRKCATLRDGFKVIFLSGYTIPKSELRKSKGIQFRVIEKPCRPGALLTAIREMLSNSP